MPARWRIEHWPECDNHVFLSHSAEDRHALVAPVFDELVRRRIIPWIDLKHYPLGREAIAALQEKLLRCRHVIYFITPAMLRQGRGWPGAERALAATIQQHLRRGEEIAHVELPLLFVEPTEVAFQRSVWRSLIDKAQRCPHALPPPSGGTRDNRRDWRAEHVSWAADVAERFVRQEDQWALQLGERFGGDPELVEAYGRDLHLLERLVGKAPSPSPAP